MVGVGIPSQVAVRGNIEARFLQRLCQELVAQPKADRGINVKHARVIRYAFDRLYGDEARTFLEPGGPDDFPCYVRLFLVHDGT